VRRAEALRWKETAARLRSRQLPALGDFLMEDIARLARSTVPFYGWLPYRLKASSTSLPIDLTETATALDKGRQLLSQGNDLGALRLKSTCLAAEAKFAPGHPVLQATRSRAAHMLREFGQWREADDLLARGWLIESLEREWTSSGSSVPSQ
jgi:hypothetical protein